jgi:uncharacterized protein with von Willebrand factor type A (vWA) domain
MRSPDELAPGIARLCVEFCRRLRDAGLPVPSTAAADLLAVAVELPPADRRRFHACARATLTVDRRDWPLFDAVFHDFWRLSHGADSEFAARGSRGLDPVPANLPSSGAPPQRTAEDGDRRPSGGGFGATPRADPGDLDDAAVEAAVAASWGELLGGREVRNLRPGQLTAAEHLLPLARRCIPEQTVRRPAPGPRAVRTSLRRTLREITRNGGVVSLPVMLDLQRRQRRIVLICDASRSMRLYTQAVLGLPRLLSAAADPVEVFFFASRLSRVTHLMRRPPSAVLRGLADEVPDWGGATRIGEALGAFNRRWARRVLGSGAVVVLVTDGLDAGDPAVLAREAAHLRRSSWRLVWLNPLAAGAGFEPRATGIRTLLGEVDLMLPCREVASIEHFLHTLGLFRGRRDSDLGSVRDRSPRRGAGNGSL